MYNSGYPIDDGLIEFANRCGKKLEWLSFTGNEKMILLKEFTKKYNTVNVKCQRVALYPAFSGQSGTMGIDYKVSRPVLIGKTLASTLGFYCMRKIR